MFKRFLFTIPFAMASLHAVAAIDVNTADESALRSLNGIGSARARAIVDERMLNGPFRDAADLAVRVRGLGGQTLERLQAEGLAVGPDPFSEPRETPRAAPSRTSARAAAVVIKR